jgi:hypothetical protein
MAKILSTLNPFAIVTLVKWIVPNVSSAQQVTYWDGPKVNLPYPGRWYHHRKEFFDVLMPLIRLWGNSGAIDSAVSLSANNKDVDSYNRKSK